MSRNRGPRYHPPPAEPHACERALERYGMTISALELQAIEERVALGEGMLLSRAPDGASVRVIRIQGELVTLAVAPNGHIKTFLPKDAPMKKRAWFR